MDMEFIETPIFTKAITELLSDDEYYDFQKYLVENPESGDVIKGGFGIRKIRWNLANRGKSGSIRVYLLLQVSRQSNFLNLCIYQKEKI